MGEGPAAGAAVFQVSAHQVGKLPGDGEPSTDRIGHRFFSLLPVGRVEDPLGVDGG